MKIIQGLLLGLISYASAESLAQSLEAAFSVKADTPKGMAYMDMSQVYGTGILTHGMKWWPKVYIDQDAADGIINPIFDRLTKSDIDTIGLEFAQVASIGSDLNGVKALGHDLINMMVYKGEDNKGNPMPYTIGEGGSDNFLTYFNTQAKSKGFKLRLAIGGTAADMDAYTMPGDPDESGKDLASFLNKYKFDEVEMQAQYQLGSFLMSNGANDLIKYFKAMKADFKGTMSLCVADQIALGPGGELKLLFQHFDEIFDQLNLMMYTKKLYFLDADNDEFGIKQWQKYVPHDKLTIGFYEETNYNDKDASGGKKYDVPEGLSNGEAAAFIYSQLNKDLAAIDPKMVPLGKVFFMKDNALSYPSDKFIGDFMHYTPGNMTQPLNFLQ